MVPGGEHITNSNRTQLLSLKLYFMVDLFCGLHPLKTQQHRATPAEKILILHSKPQRP